MKIRNTIFLIICAIIFVFTLTPSYALISSALSTGGIVSANADFKIAFTSVSSTDNALATAKINPEAASITINANLTEAGQEATINFVIKNTGSLSAIVDNLSTVSTSNANLTATVVDLETIRGTSLTSGKGIKGSIIVRFEGSSDSVELNNASINIAVDYSQAKK